VEGGVKDINLNGYVPVRRGLVTHLQTGRMTVNEYVVFNLLLMLADHETGTGLINAPAIVYWSGGQLSLDGADRALRSLDKKDYIVREITPGTERLYLYRVQNFEIFWRDEKGAEHVRRTRFDRNNNKIQAIDQLRDFFGAKPAEEGADETADAPAERSAGAGAVGSADVTTREQGTRNKGQGTHDVEEEVKSAPSAQPGLGSSADQDPTVKLMRHFYKLLGQPQRHRGKGTAWVSLLKRLDADPDHISDVMDWAFENEVWARALTTVQRVDPMEYFCEKYDTIEAGMVGDKVFAEKREKRLRQVAAQTKKTMQAVAANADKPQYRQVPGSQIVKEGDVVKLW
jgi:hypothetical protein